MEKSIVEENKKKMNRLIKSSFIIIIGLFTLFFGIGLSVSLGAKHIELNIGTLGLMDVGNQLY